MFPISHYEIFSNGTELLIAEGQYGQQVAVQVWVRAGSEDETAEQVGLAHFLEHMLFKGTKNRSTGEIWQILENWGGSGNAYTSYDRTVYFVTIPIQHLAGALELLHDAVYHSVIDECEFVREREVIIEEINEYQDDPATRVREEAIRRAFSGQVHPILGYSAEKLRDFTRGDLEIFYRRHYLPSKIALVIAGAVDIATVRDHCLSLFGTVTGGCSAVSKSPPKFSEMVQSELLYGDYRQQGRFTIVLPAPPIEHIDSFAFELLAFVLGCGDASRLNTIVRDQQRLATVITSNYLSASNWGLLEINALSSFTKIEQAIAAIAEVVYQVLDSRLLTDCELTRARTNAKVDYAQQNETVSGLAGNIGYGLLTNQKHLYSDYYFMMLDRMTPALIQQAGQRWLADRQAIIVGALANDQKGKLSPSQLTDAYNRALPPKTLVTGQFTRQTPDSSPQLFELSNGTELIYRQSKSLNNIVAVTSGGLSRETLPTNGQYNALAQMWGQATAHHDYQQMVSTIEGHGASLAGFSGKDSIGLQLQCLAEDSEFFAGLFAECLQDPRFPERQWQTVRDEITDSITLREEHPSSFCLQRFNERVFAGHPYALPLAGNSLTEITPRLLKQLSRSLAKRRWVIAAVSPLSATQIRDFAEMITAQLGNNEDQPVQPPFEPLKSATYSYAKDCQQSHLICGLRGVSWSDGDRYPLEVLLAILDGQSGRLFMHLREEQGLAYSVTPVAIYGVAGGAFGTYISCAPDKEELALAGIERELSWQQRPTVDEIDRAKNFIVGNHEWEMAMGDKQAMHLALMQLYGDEGDYGAKINSVTEKDLLRVIDRLVCDRPRLAIRVGR